MSDAAIEKPKRTVYAGHKSSYRHEYVEQVRKLCKIGATEYEVGQMLGVSVMTLWRWRGEHPEFAEAFKLGREAASERVEHSVFHRAVGYTFASEKIVTVDKKVVRVPIKEHIPPDVQAQQFWLTNRRRGEWRNRQEIEVGAPGEFERLSDEELRRFIEADALEPVGAQAAAAPALAALAPTAGGIAARKKGRPAKVAAPPTLNAWD
jgi:hypothetical protein